jgi:hypothetical protein
VSPAVSKFPSSFEQLGHDGYFADVFLKISGLRGVKNTPPFLDVRFHSQR